MSQLYRFQLDMLSEKKDIVPADLVGKNVSFRVELANGSPRWFNGFVSELVAGDEDGKRRQYRAEVVPWMWFLTQTADCRIFQNVTVPEMITKIFNEMGFNDFMMNLKGTHNAWDYCVQYRETDFNFVSRLMEQEGIFYIFKHEQGKHTAVIADHIGAYDECLENKVDLPSSSSGVAVTDHLTNWSHRYEFRPGKWTQTDYNFEEPSSSLLATAKSVVSLPGIEKYEIYDYPGEYEKKSDGENETVIRMQEDEVPHDVVEAASTCRTFTPGAKFRIGQHHSSDEKGKQYVITAVQHTANEPLAYETGGGAPSQKYSNSFQCIPAEVTFRPPRSTPKPVVSGIQTAVVVGPKGEEIHCDKYGRVKVQFYWDREGKRDEKSSVWIRVAQNIAGRKWGFAAIPRIGQEVVVDFLEGDPDRPLIVGSVYNAEQMPHYELPAEKARTYIKTNSTKGGDGYNELMFDDRKDDERVFIHAQKNMDIRVRSDSKSRIYGNRHQIIGWEKDGKRGGDQREMVYQDKHQNVKRHQIEHIEGNYQLLIGHGEADEGGNLDVVVEKKKTELVEGDSDLIVKGNRKEQVDGTVSLTIGGDEHTKASGNIAIEAGATGEIHIKSGLKIIIEAGQQISLVGPGGFVDIGPAGVTVQGVMVKINSGGAAGTGSGCKAEEPEEAKKAEPATPEMAWNSNTGSKSSPD